MPRDKKKVDNIFEISLFIVFLVLAALLFLYQVIPNDIRYWVIIGCTIVYFILLVIKIVWDRVKSG
jgi:Ca2+/Na+ antiporter